MPSPTFKKMLCAGYADAVAPGDVLVVLTAAGLVSGTPVPQPMEGPSVYAGINRAAFTAYEAQFQPESPLGGNDGCFMLVDVVLRTGDGALSLPHMMVFYDSVIGISIEKAP
ncbi:hypothetical protein LJC04_04725 [Ruminococcaceae bacterium OttesenSCG-928-O06]|nr:hypothetical protein [Ruminococcaceae bacterium OttesenSCG-928-O06]